MNKLGLMLAMVMGLTIATSAQAYNAEEAVFNSPVNVAADFVHATNEQPATPARQVIRIQVEYIVNESGQNYVVYIRSNRPEIHDKIIRMVKNMPVEKGTENKKNNIVIEYEL